MKRSYLKINYELWRGMVRRCIDPKHKDYANYGAKGVTIDKRWVDSIDEFNEDMGSRPSNKHSIDRVDNNKGYSKDNCRWATVKQQLENRRLSKECLHGHPWTADSILLVSNGKGLSRRCAICVQKYKNANLR